ncbi:hypothetical protein VTI74DRAFT_5982 [Chaetomium olivicolor]
MSPPVPLCQALLGSALCPSPAPRPDSSLDRRRQAHFDAGAHSGTKALSRAKPVPRPRQHPNSRTAMRGLVKPQAAAFCTALQHGPQPNRSGVTPGHGDFGARLVGTQITRSPLATEAWASSCIAKGRQAAEALTASFLRSSPTETLRSKYSACGQQPPSPMPLKNASPS